MGAVRTNTYGGPNGSNITISGRSGREEVSNNEVRLE